MLCFGESRQFNYSFIYVIMVFENKSIIKNDSSKLITLFVHVILSACRVYICQPPRTVMHVSSQYK